MKVKTSVTLSPELLAAIDKRSGESRNRSEFIENIVRTFLHEKDREERDARDIAIINANADYLNAEAADVLAMQAAWAAEVNVDDGEG